jgi:PAS domain S-box-containing protein
LFSVTLALVLSLFLQRFFLYPFLFLFFASVMGSAWFGGAVSGLVAVLLSTLAVDFFFVRPFNSFAVSATDASYFAAFVACSLAASWVSSSKRNSEEALKEARDRLEVRVAQRTAALERSNAELRESEHQLRLLTEAIPQQIWSATPDGSIDYCNQRLLEYAGRAMEEMQGERFIETIHPEDREGFRQNWRGALPNGKPFEGEWRVRGADGQYRTFFTRSVPLRRAGGGKPLRWYGTNTAMEKRKEAEQALMSTQAELARLSRVLTMGELTASIAHEVNQPLTAVVTNGHACLEWLSGNAPNLGEARQAAERIIQDGTRAGTVLSSIRALFKKETPAKDWLDMNEVIRELTVFLRDEAMRHHIVLRADLAPDVPKVTGDRVQLQQVVLNLVMNGIEAMRGTNSGPKELRICTRKDSLEGVLVQVEDSGTGICPDIAGKIFDPFFTTKPQGIGMGLSISRSIVESHEGSLWASPRPSGGAIFQFTVPIESQARNA